MNPAPAPRMILYLVMILTIVFSLAAGAAAGYFAGRLAGPTRGLRRMESGTIPIEMVQQTMATGAVEFARPFARRPLVFVCEAGHSGAFLVCKTDAVSPSGFTWAVGAGPVRRDYQSELAWFAFEPE